MESRWDGIRITEAVSVEPVQTIPYTPKTVLLLGAIGSGKSHFIETVVNDHSLGISKDQLDGGTLEITAYKVRGLQKGSSNIYFVDIPGFSNPNISELKIVDMIRTWVEKSVSPIGAGSLSYILYFDRITDPRSTGNKEKLAALFKELLGTRTAGAVTIVTTMWDELRTEAQRERANARFEQLKDQNWKDILTQGAKLVKFENTQDSALTILRDVVTKSPNWKEFSGLNRGYYIRDTGVAPFLRQSVMERINTTIQRIGTINEDLEQESTKADMVLYDLLLKEKADLEILLNILQQDSEQCTALPQPKTKPRIFSWFSSIKYNRYAKLSDPGTTPHLKLD